MTFELIKGFCRALCFLCVIFLIRLMITVPLENRETVTDVLSAILFATAYVGWLKVEK